jgi:hypothetical protein
LVWPGLEIGGKLGASRFMLKTMLTRLPDLDRWESERGHPMLTQPVLAHDSDEWRTTAQQQRLALLEPGDRPTSVPARLFA